jgi:hypothetical protein
MFFITIKLAIESIRETESMGSTFTSSSNQSYPIIEFLHLVPLFLLLEIKDVPSGIMVVHLVLIVNVR